MKEGGSKERLDGRKRILEKRVEERISGKGEVERKDRLESDVARDED